MTDLTHLTNAAGALLADPDDWTSADLLRGLPSRLHAIYQRMVAVNPHHPAFIENGVTWSYGDFAEAVDAVAEALKALAVRPGDRVMIVSENSVAASAFVMAASKIDAWAIVANPRLSARELDQIYEHSGARRRFFMCGISFEASGHADRCCAARSFVGPFPDIGIGALNEGAEVETVHADGSRQVAVLIYTSGTTGMPKGVMLSHRNLLFAARTSGLLRAVVPNDRVYAVLPMSHIVGLSIGLVSTLMFGATNVAVPKYDPAHLAQSFASDGITILSGVPATYQRLLAYKSTAGLSPLNKGRLRLIGVAGAPLDPALKKRVEQELGLPLLNAFGITECAPGISGVRQDDPQADETVGRILPGIETRLVRADGQAASEGEVGELHVRGANIMLGYYKAQDLTDKAVDGDGWFATGDLARFSGRYLYIVGRAKEMIIRSGFNVYPAEVEAVISEHPAVQQSAVVGRAVENNEEVVAFVQLLPGADVTPEELSAFVSPLLTAYKRPSCFIVLDTLPAGSTGKILKHKLKEIAAAI